MAVQDGVRLRQLVGDYYHGLITPDSYRARRAQLLDNIGTDIAENSETDTEVPLPSRETKSIKQESVPTDSDILVASSRPKRLVIGAMAIVGFAAVGFLVMTQMPDSGTEPDSQMEHSGPVPQSGLERGDALVEEFLFNNDWTEDSLNNFLLAWGALDDGQRQLVTEGRRYRRLTTALHQRIREETALAGAPDSGRLATLMNFAITMGSPYRESRASSIEQKAATEAPSKGDVVEEPEFFAADSDVTAAAANENGAAAPESFQATVVPADASNQPVDDVAAKPEKAQSVTTETSEMVDDPCSAGIANTRQPYCEDTLPDGSMGPPLIVLPTGTFEMGSNSVASESPSHQVDIAYHIAFSRYEITAKEYEQFCAATSLPCADQPWDDDSPVVSVSWDDATLYTQWLSEATGFQYRLPSEAEWEYAARARTQSPYYFGDEITPSAAHSAENGTLESPLSRSDRSINRNPFRLYHMSGNVREWTQDAWHPNYDDAPRNGSARRLQTEDLRAVRGGSYNDPGAKLRSAAREPLDRSHRDAMTGFRVVREVLLQATESVN